MTLSNTESCTSTYLQFCIMPCGKKSLVNIPCGKKPLVKKWDKPRDIQVIKPSRYQQNEASVKVHWKKVISDLESSYKDEQFWDTQAKTVRELVGPVIFGRLTKIFNLQLEDETYVPASETSSIQPSDAYYRTASQHSKSQFGFGQASYSLSDFEPEEDEAEERIGNEDSWSTSSLRESVTEGGGGIPTNRSTIRSFRSMRSMNRSMNRSMVNRSGNSGLGKNFSKLFTTMSRTFSKNFQRSASERALESRTTWDTSAGTDDDILVQASFTRLRSRKSKHGASKHRMNYNYNPHFEMLYCNESETDMIKWKSNYKQKKFEVSASDEYSKKAEILTKEIATEFFDWWVALGSGEFKSEIKRSTDIEDLYQVWFEEHASRGLVVEPKIRPCVHKNIADYVGAQRTSCPRVLKRQIAKDIHAESKPKHTLAFGKCLPARLKHIPPQNNTKEIWQSLKIPKDLESMAAVWEDISNLTSTKAFQKWLAKHPYMPMPPYLEELALGGEKKPLFVIPSDFVVRRKSMEAFSNQELNIPVSQFSLEIKEVLSKLLND